MNILTIVSVGYTKLEMRTASLSTKNKVPEYSNTKETFVTLSAGLLNCATLTHKDHTTFNVTGLAEEESPRYL
jgi:hypothetical protein